MASLPLPVALIGLGGVGKAILTQLITTPTLSSKFQLVFIANSKLSLSLPLPTGSLPLTPTNFLPILEQYGNSLDVQSIISILSTHPSGRPGILVDATGSESLVTLFPQILGMGVNIVTANKKGTSGDLQLYQNILNNTFPYNGVNRKVYYYGESTAGAGLPILSSLKELIETGDEIKKIEGVFSGTLSYIFNQFSSVSGGDVKFSDVLRVAKDNGYTEPDPRDDLSGTDVARKLTILSRLIPSAPQLPEGYASVPTQSLVPDVLSNANTKEEYMSRIEEGDSFFNDLNSEAKKEGKVVRYVGVIDLEEGKIACKLEKYPFDHPFATALQGSDNIVSFHTKRYSPRPFTIQGSGAGADVTAMGVTGDMLKVHDRLA